MQDPDDLFTDDITFDDQTLALLDEQEQKFLPTSASRNSPPAKRQKTAHGGIPQRFGRISVENWEDLPEISVRSDGTYGFRDANNSAATARTLWPSTRAQPTGPVVVPGRPQPPARLAVATGPTAHSRVTTQAVNRAPSVSSQIRPSSVRRRDTRQTVRGIPLPRNNQINSLADKESSVNRGTSSPDESSQIAELRRQVEELKNANQKLNTDLQEATDIRFTKEGEVSILRKNIERSVQDHAAQVARLKAAKEEADAKQIQIQKEMKEEMERLKTQFTFKQHELETSTTKGSSSVRSRKISRDLPQTPSLVQSQFRGWNQLDIGDAGPSKAPFGISPLPRFGVAGKEGTYGRHRRLESDSEDSKTTMLPGFQNAFIARSPNRVPLKRLDKGKARELGDPNEYQPPDGSFFYQSTPRSPVLMRGMVEADSGVHDLVQAEDNGHMLSTKGSVDGDVNMLLDDDETQQPFDDSGQSEPYNWKSELYKIILTHSYPSYMSPTLQTLISATPSSNAQADTYRAACGGILDVVSSTSRSCDTFSALCGLLLSIAHLLNVNRSVFPLTALLSLFSCLASSLPSFCHTLLSERQVDESNAQSTPKIVLLLRDIVRDHLAPPKPPDEDYAPDIQELGKETLRFLDVLCWNTPDEHAEQLSGMPLSHSMLLTMLDASQPSWMRSRCARVLVFLASHTSLYRHLLPLTRPSNAQVDKESNKVSYIKCLSTCLIDARRQDKEVDSLKTYALTFVALLSIAHTDALFNLLESPTLIPSLVVFLSQLATPIWEDDNVLMSSLPLVTSSIRSLNQTLLLLHHLVFSADPVFDLRHKLVHAPHRQFNGITNMFIVTLGRLSYADPPSWVDSNSKLELERLADMARDLLELLVEGPESDNIWDVYQGGDMESEPDDEEKEARLLVADDV